MVAERPDGVDVIHIRVGVGDSDDDRPEGPVVLSSRRQHGGDQRRAVVLAQRQEQRHFALNVRL